MSIIPLNKLFNVNANKYEFTKGTMSLIKHIGHLPEYKEEELHWKVVPNILKIMFDSNIQYAEVIQEKPETSENSEK